MPKQKPAFSLFFLLLAATSLIAATNSLTITEKGGVATANYPIQIARPFVQGEISNFPQAVVSGTPVTTQADIKQRWPDGSVKHAVLAFLIPQLNAGASVTVTFRNQTAGNNSSQSLAQMQASAFDFNAQMLLTNGSTLTADARKMLNAGAYSLWTSGTVAQTVVLADHSLARAYDIGFDANHSFRPIFHATFWPGINKVRVRFIGEIANTEALQDQAYSLTLKLGNATPAQVYSKAQFTHTASTRWTKEFWIGGAPSAIAIDHNLAYIKETKFVPNYDTSKALPSATITSGCTSWTNAAKDLYDAGNWTKYQPMAGARPDIGPYPDWVVAWLYTGDKCLQDRALGNADLSAAWPVHYREGKSGKNILRTDPAGAGTGVGRVLSLSSRPTISIVNLNYDTVAADQINAVGATSNGGWVYDTAHEPDVASVAYALTGDFWYLEEMWFWASMDAASNYASVYHRGPTGAEGVLNHSQIRGMAWELRNRVNTAFITPDGTPEKSYFTTLINDAIALEEGARNITGTAFTDNAVWNWGRNQFAPTDAVTAFGSLGVTPLHQWAHGSVEFAQNEYGICSSTGAGTPCGPTVSEATALFESDYMLFALGRAKELGYPTGPLVSWLGSLYTGMLTNPGFNPYIIDNGRVPTVRSSDHKYFTTFADLKTGYNSTWQARTSLSTAGDPDGYAAYVSAAVSFLTGEPNGQASWDFMNREFYTVNTALNTNPKWAILPRTGGGSPVPTSPCDLNSDGKTDSSDVQIATNQSIGLAGCSADLDSSGKCDVVDTQRVINASLGQTCRVGP